MLTILFNPKVLRLSVDLGMLKVPLACAKSICPLFTQEISERSGRENRPTSRMLCFETPGVPFFPHV